MPKYLSEMESPDDLIHKYATPPASSSPIACRTYLDNYAPHQGTSGAAAFLSFSPPQQAPQHQRTLSTNSGYMRRPQLFGREQAFSSSAKAQPSRGLERIAERQRKGLPSPEMTSSPKMQKQRKGAMRTPQFLRERRETSCVSAINSEPDRSSMMREDVHDIEVSEAPLLGDGYGPGPTVTSKPHFRSREQSSDIIVSHPTAGSDSPGSRYDRRAAEQMLRQSQRNAERNSQADSSRTSKRSGHLFRRQKPTVSGSASFRTHFSDDNISELSYIEPYLASMPIQPDENMSKGRVVAHREQQQELHSPDQFNNQNKGNGSSLLRRTATADHKDTTSNQSLRKRRPLTPTMPVLSPRDAFLLDLEEDLREEGLSDTSMKDNTTAKDVSHAVMQPSALHRPLGRVCRHLNTALMSPQYLKLSNDTVARDQAPTLMSSDLSVSPIMAVVSQEPKDVHQQLAYSDIMEIMSQEPIASSTPHGLSFAAANAIVYCCTTFAAMRFTFVNIGRDIQSTDLATEMVMAAFAGLIVCLLVHIVRKWCLHA